MELKSSKNLGLASLVAVNPFAAFVVGLLHPRDPSSKNLVWAFIVFYGAVFYISEASGTDSVRYLAQLNWMHGSDFSLDDLMYRMYKGQGSFQDLYQPFVTFLVSRFTDQAWALFATFGILLGYVYSRNTWFLVERIGTRHSAVAIFLVIAFAMNVNFAQSLNGVRFWTACHVFIFGVFFYFDRLDPKYLLVSLVTPLIHFTFVMPCALLLGFLLVRRYGAAIYFFFVVSFFVAQLDLTLVKSILQYLPLSFTDHSASYVGMLEAPVRYGSSHQAIWFLRLNSQLTFLFILAVPTYLYWRGFHRARNTGSSIYLLGMLIYGATNFVSYVPSVGRFFSIGEMLIIAAVVLFLGHEQASKKDRQLLGAASILLAIKTALGVRMSLEFASVYLLFGNFFIAPFVEPDVGLYEFFKI